MSEITVESILDKMRNVVIFDSPESALGAMTKLYELKRIARQWTPKFGVTTPDLIISLQDMRVEEMGPKEAQDSFVNIKAQLTPPTPAASVSKGRETDEAKTLYDIGIVDGEIPPRVLDKISKLNGLTWTQNKKLIEADEPFLTVMSGKAAEAIRSMLEDVDDSLNVGIWKHEDPPLDQGAATAGFVRRDAPHPPEPNLDPDSYDYDRGVDRSTASEIDRQIDALSVDDPQFATKLDALAKQKAEPPKAKRCASDKHQYIEKNDGAFGLEGLTIPYLKCTVCGYVYHYDQDTSGAETFAEYMVARTEYRIAHDVPPTTSSPSSALDSSTTLHIPEGWTIEKGSTNDATLIAQPPAGVKLTETQRKWLTRIAERDGERDYWAMNTPDKRMATRMEKKEYIYFEITPGNAWRARLTDAGRAALSAAGKTATK